ncbi:XRE family transcriptional regulator [Psychrobacter sp. UBA3480]|nr:XRE family transcriptional regulator [Psychrobacter sp. UBA3480]
MNESAELVVLALKLLKCNQKTLAEKLSVSATQITKWKAGDYISIDMREKIENMLDLKGMPTNMVLMSGSVENAIQWTSLIDTIASIVGGMSETGYETKPLVYQEELGELGWSTFLTLDEMGVVLPDTFPNELKEANQAYNDDSDEYDNEEAFDVIINNPYSALIYKIYKNLNDVYGFYAAYVHKIMFNDELDLFCTDADNIEPSLMDLAASKLNEEDTQLATNFLSFRLKTKTNFEEWLNIVKLAAIERNVPLGAELLDMIHQSSDALCHNAERQALGLNKERLHPDIYMNELLVGMRTMHAVLPHILKKLDIQVDVLGSQL